jgi:hypothetical protein
MRWALPIPADSGRKTTTHGPWETIQAGKRQVGLHVFMLRHVNFSNNRYDLFTLNAHLLLNEATIYDFNKK